MSAERVSEKMLTAAVEAAVREGLLPKGAPEDVYVANWQRIRRVLEAALDAERRSGR